MARDEPIVSTRAASVTVRKAQDSDVPSLTKVLARAFAEDPMINWLLGKDPRRIERFFGIVLTKWTVPHGEVYATADLDGTALWTPPGKWSLSLWKQLGLLPHFAAVVGLRGLPTLMAAMDGLDKKHPHVPHFYLAILGVEPARQGRGLGTQLLRVVLERCDQEGLPAYLEASSERNVPLYKRNGFRVTEELRVARDAPTLWLMWRDPQ